MIIDARSARQILEYYSQKLQRRIREYADDLARSHQEWLEKKASLEKAYGSEMPFRYPVFTLVGRQLDIRTVLEVCMIFIKERPENRTPELTLLIRQNADLRQIGEIITQAEEFLRKLPGAIPPARPKIVQYILENK